MTFPNVYTDNDNENNYQVDLGQDYFIGYADGVFDTLSQIQLEGTTQVASEDNYLSIAKINQERIILIMENYELVDEKSVHSFLFEKPSIIDLVNKTFLKVQEFIPKIKKTTLEVFIDPEDDQKSLLAKIYPDLPIDDALDRLDCFDREWFASKFVESDTLFNISLDFEE